MKYLIKYFILLVVLLLSTYILAAELKPVIDVPSKYRTIDTKSTVALEWGIKGVGLGNIIFSSKELPFKEEDKYEDIRDTFYFGKDSSIHCRAYYPGTVESLIKIVQSKVKNAEFVEKWAIMTVEGGGARGAHGESKASFPNDEKSLGWDTQRFDLLPYVGGDDQDFTYINLSDKNSLGKGENRVDIDLYLEFQTGTKLVTRTEGDEVVTREEPVYSDYLISHGNFKYIVE